MLNWRKPLIHALLAASASRVPKQLALARRVSRLSPEQLHELQRERLQALLEHAWRHTDYYRSVLADCGVVRDGAVQLDRFERIPFLTKEILRREGPSLRAAQLPRGHEPYRNRTGGSTGQPCEFWQDSHYDAGNTADKLFHFESFGKTVGEPELKIWGAQRDLVRDTGSTTARIKNYLYNRKVESCGTLSAERIREIIECINHFRPRAIWAYVDGLFTISRYATRHDLQLHSPAAVFCGGGTLLPHMQDAIAEAFRCPVVNYYGSREMGAVACQCPESLGLHITSHSHVVEVVDESGKAVTDCDGELVLTSLTNYAMPFIRYRIGDRGRLASAPCPCGSPAPVLESVSGRSIESLIKTHGELVSPIFLITLLGGTLGSGSVEKFQIVQERLDRIVLKAVVDPAFHEERIANDLELVRSKLAGVMGDGCEILCERVQQIPPEASGKYLYTRCDVDRETLALEMLEGFPAAARQSG